MNSAHHARETVDLLRQETPNFIPPDLCRPRSTSSVHPNILEINPVDYKIWVRPIMQHRLYLTKIYSVDERRVIDVWCRLEQTTIDMHGY